MSYSIQEAKGEETAIIQEAIKNDDEVTLFLHSDLAAAMGDDEDAHKLRKLAYQARRNNWAYDEANNN